jgi:hypothetical protein
MLKFRNERRQSRCQNDQITSVNRFVSVGNSRRNEDRTSRPDIDLAIGEPKSQDPFQDVPGLVITMMHVQNCGPASSPFVDFKRTTTGRKTLRGVGRVECDDRFHNELLISIVTCDVSVENFRMAYPVPVLLFNLTL